MSYGYIGDEFMMFKMIMYFCARKLLGSAGSWFIAIRCIMLS